MLAAHGPCMMVHAAMMGESDLYGFLMTACYVLALLFLIIDQPANSGTYSCHLGLHMEMRKYGVSARQLRVPNTIN